MSEVCQWLHEQLQTLPLVTYPFSPGDLPENGIYFFYEHGEMCSHVGSKRQRIVRVGTHRDGNFRSRMAEHYLLDARRLSFTTEDSPPHDRSIFRKHLGRALLSRARDDYLKVWNIDFTLRANRERYRHLRDVRRERQIETRVSRILRERFAFRFIALEGQAARMGATGLESGLIGTLTRCGRCRPSKAWLGREAPDPRIGAGGLWQVQHLKAPALDGSDRQVVTRAAAETRAWLEVEKSRR